MTVKRKRFKSYAAAEEAAVRARDERNTYFWAVRGLLENKVRWLSVAFGSSKVRAGVAWPESACGGIVIVVQELPSNNCYDVYEVDHFVSMWADYISPDAGAQAMRRLAQDVAMLRNRMIDEAEDKHATGD